MKERKKDKLNGVTITCNPIDALIKLDVLIHILFEHFLVPFKIVHSCLHTSCVKVKGDSKWRESKQT
jgi:hypothetical protein